MKKKNYVYPIMTLLVLCMFAMVSCKKDDDENTLMSFNKTKVKVTFGTSKSISVGENLILQTPAEYHIGLYSAKLLGTNGTPDHQLFHENDFANAQEFAFTDGSVSIDLNGGSTIPDGEYVSFVLGIYYLQMKLQIATTNRGVEWRNMRIYFCDHGDFKRGDVVQYDDQGNIQGWLFGEGQLPDFDPISPRSAAYTHGGNGTSWYQFADKPGQTYGPFGNMSFWNSVPNPYNKHVGFTFIDNSGSTLVIDFNVNNCWEFGDFNGDGYFGGHDLDPVNPSPWHMNLPAITITLQP